MLEDSCSEETGMAEQKKQPELFKANLFSSPGPGPAAGGLSFGLTTDSFNSSFSLAPALTPVVPAASPPAAKKQEVKVTPPATSPATSTPAVKSTPIYSMATPTPAAADEVELSTVPLDSPPPPTSSSPAGHLVTPDPATPHRPLPDAGQALPLGPGWNDPPLNSTPAGPSSVLQSGMGTPDMFSLQPLAGQPDASQATPMATPPVASVAPQQQVSNPYRLGQSGPKRVVYGGVATPPSQHPQPSLPTLLPSLQSTYPQTQPAVAAVPQEVGVSPPPEGVVQQLRHHWFYLRPSERYWIPFSLIDSASLEQAWAASTANPSQQVLVPTDGGRYDVDLVARSRTAIYWSEPVSHVRRCSWFYKGDSDRWYLPYTEDVAALLEEEFMQAMAGGVWGGRVEVGEGEAVVLHSQTSIAHYSASQLQSVSHDLDYSSSCSVLRGFAEIDQVEQGEQSRVDHLVFVVHGIGEHHDLSFRCLIDCVDDFREVSQLMLKTHRFTGQAPREADTGGRVEFLPVHWHTALHGDSLGVDQQLQKLSLRSISRLRSFTNSTLLDILFFTSPVYLQTIVDQVAGEMNRMYDLFLQRNPGYSGGVSLMGHSLGSCILFDILAHQTRGVPGEIGGTGSQPNEDVSQEGEEKEREQDTEEDVDMPATLEAALSHLGLSELTDIFLKEQFDFDSLLMTSNEDLKELGIAMGHRKKLSSFISSEGERIRVARERRARVEAERKAREQEEARQQQEASQRQTRLEGVKFVKGEAGTGQPHVLFPQLHFETENLFALGSPIGLFLIVRGVEELGPEYKLPRCPQIFNIFHPFDPVAYRLEPLVCDTPPEKPVLMPHHKGRKRFHLELYETVGQVGASMKHYVVEGMRNMWQQLNELARSHRSSDQPQLLPQEEPDTPSTPEVVEMEKEMGRLNGGRRVDYVLQEKPIEKLNEYLFALSSHLSYWRSEDTALFILKEVYGEPNPELIKS